MSNKKPFLMYLDNDLKETIRKLAKEDDRSIAYVIEKVLKEKLQQKQESK